MMDKVEIPLPKDTEYRQEARSIRMAVLNKDFTVPATASRYYAGRTDLRKTMGLDAMFHVNSRFGNHGDKLEILHCGEKTYDEITTIVSRVVEGDPEKKSVRRLDLCADTEVAVEWYAKSVRRQYARWRAEIGEVELYDEQRKTMQFMDIGKRKLETMYLGRQPNPLRIYDKVAETKHRFEREQRGHYRIARNQDDFQAARLALRQAEGRALDTNPLDNDARRREKALLVSMHPFVTFHDWTGGTLWEWQTLTRVERQISGELPVVLTTLGAVRDNVLNFNPFQRVQFAAPDKVPHWSDLEGFSQLEKMAGGMMWHLLTEEGWTYDQLYKFFGVTRTGKSAGGNAKRIMAKFEPWLAKALYYPEGKHETGISGDMLFEKYRSSIKRQLCMAA